MAERQSDYCNPLAHAAEGYLGYCYGRAHKNGKVLQLKMHSSSEWT